MLHYHWYLDNIYHGKASAIEGLYGICVILGAVFAHQWIIKIKQIHNGRNCSIEAALKHKHSAPIKGPQVWKLYKVQKRCQTMI